MRMAIKTSALSLSCFEENKIQKRNIPLNSKFSNPKPPNHHHHHHHHLFHFIMPAIMILSRSPLPHAPLLPLLSHLFIPLPPLSLASNPTLSLSFNSSNSIQFQFHPIHFNLSLSMALSGFEGFEKRLELHFSGDDPVVSLGLRFLDFDSLVEVLNAVQCTVVSAVGNRYFDAYVLSESSLFVYPTKIIVKTCGTTQLLKSIRPLIIRACNLGLSLRSVRYTRGSFIFPASQPFPHTSFADEVVYIEQNLPPSLCYRKASVMPSNTAARSWHVFTAVDEESFAAPGSSDLFTVEVCMTELDRALARKFFQPPGGGEIGDVAGKEMTKLTGIGEINPGAIICDFAFDPCGYSMNGIDCDRYSTIHVTPEDGFSYASFECVGSVSDGGGDIARVLQKVVQVFRPAVMSVSTTCSSCEVWARVARAVEPLGMKCRSCAADEFPAGGSVVFQTFTVRRK